MTDSGGAFRSLAFLMPEIKVNNGVLFPNRKGNNDRRPDYVGVANVEGKTFKLAAWTRTDRKGKQYLKLAFSTTDPIADNREDNT